MNTYLIASLRGKDFKIKGDSPEDAWMNLFEQEYDNGSLWKTHDYFRNVFAVENQGFTYFDKDDPTSGAYKLIE